MPHCHSRTRMVLSVLGHSSSALRVRVALACAAVLRLSHDRDQMFRVQHEPWAPIFCGQVYRSPLSCWVVELPWNNGVDEPFA